MHFSLRMGLSGLHHKSRSICTCWVIGTRVRWHWNFFPFYHSLSSSFSSACPLNHSVVSSFVITLLLSNYILVVPGDTISQDLNFCLLGWSIWKFANIWPTKMTVSWVYPIHIDLSQISCQLISLPIFRSIYPTFSICLHLDVPQAPQSQFINLPHHMCLSRLPTSVNGTIHPVTQGTDLHFLTSLLPLLSVMKGLLILSILWNVFTSSYSHCLFSRSKLLSPFSSVYM